MSLPIAVPSSPSCPPGALSCILCGAMVPDLRDIEHATVACNVREFAHQRFTAWRCPRCASVHCLEPIDAPRYYANYPVRLQRYDFFARRICRKRLSLLIRHGLVRGQTLLDYGCGSGHFVRYAREQGYQAVGYDPYSGVFGDPAVLAERYDWVTSQDVIEHDADPAALLATLRGLVRPGGRLAVGTPDADGIDLGRADEQIETLHLPYHQHLFARRRLEGMVAVDGWTVEAAVPEHYMDTRFPFVNAAFLYRYLRHAGGVLDVGFEPIRPWLFIRHPTLWFHALFGSLLARREDVLLIARDPVRVGTPNTTMMTSPRDILGCALAITLLVAGAVVVTALAVAPITQHWCGSYHVIADLVAGLTAYGVLSALAIRALLRIRPLASGQFDLDHPTARYWKLLTVIHRLGEWALRPFTTVFSQPIIARLFGARIGAGAVLGGAIEDPFLVTVGCRAVLGGDSRIAGSMLVDGRLTIGPVRIGTRAQVGVKSVVFPGAIVGERATLAGGSILTAGAEIPVGETWRGIPARRWISSSTVRMAGERVA